MDSASETPTPAGDRNWIEAFPQSGHPALRLICFPFAGGGTSTFRSWPAGLPAAVQVCGVQLPGHESRWNEPLSDNLEQLVKALASALASQCGPPFAFFGHSMGALFAFELAKRLCQHGAEGPVHLFVSGFRAPHLPSRFPPMHALPRAELISRLQELGGAEAWLENDELINLQLPILRADLKACETFEGVDGPMLNCPISAFGGVEDRMATRQELDGWRECTSDRFLLQMFAGGHFFIEQTRDLLLWELSRALRQLLLWSGGDA